ncbi:MAG: hypothetical protein ACIAXF_09610 [Phycisphaerales bacterium JB063]
MRWVGVWACLLTGVAMQPGCVVRDRAVIVPRDWSAQQADAGEAAQPHRPGGRVGTNAVLPAAPDASDSAGPTIEPAPEPVDPPVVVVDAEPDAEPTPDPVPAPEPSTEDEGDAVAQGEPEAQPEPETPPTPEPETQPATALDPPLHPAWAEDSVYNRLYVVGADPATANGAIDAVGTFIPAEGASPGLLLTLNNGGTSISVHVAPLRYLRAVGLRFDFGEPLSIKGRWGNIDGKRVLLAQSITRGDVEVVVRDPQTGRPVWVDPLPAQGDTQDPDQGENDTAPPSV